MSLCFLGGRRHRALTPMELWRRDHREAVADLDAARRDLANGIGTSMRDTYMRVFEAEGRLHDILDARPRPEPIWKRLTPWWLITWLPLLVIPVGLLAAPKASALMYQQKLIVSVVWTGQPECITMWLPDSVAPINACSPTRQWSQIVYVPRGSTRLVGVDPEMSGADTMSCAIASVSGRTLYSDFGVRGDGYEVTCLVPWTA
ncbi:hypothetical protein [Mycolicibacterium goodii]|uniref:hypothetical protein n=1 Tax=Mycolicibacterium goodii TaxID=134601 RepID=UPI001BDC7CA7|nr:hypothetical protein [Mycolicibacterium goodii]MBU8834150.1 hypothetical protein [Mycolicibacterium goodii]